MAEETISQEIKLKNIDETRNSLFEEINQNELMSKKYTKTCATLNYIEPFLILGSTITGCVSLDVFLQLLDVICIYILVGIPVGIASFAIGLEICTINTAIKNVSQ